MLYALGVLIFAVGLLLSIALHEIGHMVPAKKFGVKVTQYMVGFGPTVWSRKRGDTEYGAQGDPARRLHPDDRHGAAGARGREALALAAPDVAPRSRTSARSAAPRCSPATSRASSTGSPPARR